MDKNTTIIEIAVQTKGFWINLDDPNSGFNVTYPDDMTIGPILVQSNKSEDESVFSFVDRSTEYVGGNRYLAVPPQVGHGVFKSTGKYVDELLGIYIPKEPLTDFLKQELVKDVLDYYKLSFAHGHQWGHLRYMESFLSPKAELCLAVLVEFSNPGNQECYDDNVIRALCDAILKELNK